MTLERTSPPRAAATHRAKSESFGRVAAKPSSPWTEFISPLARSSAEAPRGVDVDAIVRAQYTFWRKQGLDNIEICNAIGLRVRDFVSTKSTLACLKQFYLDLEIEPGRQP